MSMVLINNTDRSAARRSNPWYASALARFIQQRRAEMGMTVAEAAALSGLAASEWAALEAGWIPQNRNVQRAIAGTLEVVDEQIILLAYIGSYNQPLSA